ncbi:hypothetical protein JXA32_17095 [Candidatus Sumerlaeota bacterium]|nr:hypothetical protein [Candidatus Sumerlaeota bacterium]
MQLSKLAQIQIGIGVIALIALQANITLCIRELKQARSDQKNEVAEYESNYAALKESLPGHGTVGYFTDQKDDLKSFFLAQYALSPVFVVDSIEPELIVADLHDPESLTQLHAKHGLVVLRKTSDQIFLLRKTNN